MNFIVGPLAALALIFRRVSPARATSLPPDVGSVIEPVYPDNWAALNLSDEEVITAAITSPAWNSDELDGRSLHLLCPDALIKFGPMEDKEYLASELARTSTSLKIPKIHRLIVYQEDPDYVFMVMERIEGRTLAQCWAELSLWRKIMVMWTLRGYVRQLRSIANPQPGRPGSLGSRSGGPHDVCFGPLFGSYGGGPFDSYEAMVQWLNLRLAVSTKYDKAPPSAPPFDMSYPLVFTHNDLKPENLILDNKKQLWMIDFGQSGFYPAPFEYVAMHVMWSGRKFQPQPWVTNILVGFTTGWYYSYYYTMFRNICWAVEMGVTIDNDRFKTASNQ